MSTPAPTNDTLLSPEQQAAFLELLEHGASRSVAGRKVGVSLAAVEATQTTDAGFDRLVRESNTVRSENIAAALYQTALKGSVPAQAAWLRQSPPPDWIGEKSRGGGFRTFDELCEALSDDELDQLTQALVAFVLRDGRGALDQASGREPPGAVS